jgi:urease accessory protein UreF
MEGVQYEDFWIALQLCDSGFPSGSLAISSGLESAVQHGNVTKGNKSLESFVKMNIEQAIAQSLPFVRHTYVVFYGEEDNDLCINTLNEADKFCHATITNLPARRSSINQGKTRAVLFCQFH